MAVVLPVSTADTYVHVKGSTKIKMELYPFVAACLSRMNTSVVVCPFSPSSQELFYENMSILTSIEDIVVSEV